MISFFKWTHQGVPMAELLKEYGINIGLTAQFADQAYKNVKFLLMKNYITEEEAQTIVNRIIADVGREIKQCF